MKHLYLAFAGLLIPFLLQAQANFQKGLVVTSQGDTLRGYLNYREFGDREPSALEFKTSESDKTIQEFTPATSSYVEITGMVRYQSYQGRISMDAIATRHLTHFPDTTSQAAQVYLKVVQQGKNASLFSFTDQLKTRYFMQISGGEITELGFKKFFYNQSSSIRTHKTYTGQLWLAATKLQLGTPALHKQIQTTQYNAKDLVAIVNQLNQLDPREQQKMKPGNRTRFFTGLGFNQTTFGIEGNHDLTNNTKSKLAYSPTLSFGADVFRNPDIQQFFLRGEAILHFAKADISGNYQHTLYDWEERQTFLQPTLSIAPQLVYNLYNGKNLKFNLGVGAALNFSLYADNVYYEQSTTRTEDKTVREWQTKEYYRFAGAWYSLPIRAGLILNQKTDISVIYSMPAAISQYHSFAFTRTTLQVSLNYLFRKAR